MEDEHNNVEKYLKKKGKKSWKILIITEDEVE
jgi:hypothetical protein